MPILRRTRPSPETDTHPRVGSRRVERAPDGRFRAFVRDLTPYRVACIVATLALVAIICLNDLGHFDTDIKPEVYLAPWDMVGRYLSSWTGSPYLGSANFNVGLVPVLLVLSLLRLVGFSPEWTFKVFHVALWFVAAWGTMRLTRVATPRESARTPWLALAAGIFYLANPYAIAAGNTLAIALPMAFLPWMLLCYLRAMQRPTSWAWPAAFGLTFFAMSGMNVAVVPLLQLFALVPIAVVARMHHLRTWREIIRVTARCALFVFLVSLYWLVPGVDALGAGTQIVDSSETLTGIHKVSSFTEVLRGLGLWPLYGHGDAGPWVPQNAVYVTNPAVIALTALWPALALVSLRWARTSLRRVLVLVVGVAATIMVGLFPGEGRAQSPLGWLLQAVLSFPPLAAFRTTNKIGALLALAFAMALAGGALLAVRSLRGRAGITPIAGALASITVAAWILPALAGGLYISRMDVPSYWRDAAAAADKGNPNSTSLLLPGQTRPSYRWTVQRPDDLTNSLLKRDAVIPETTPNASAPGANFLAALDDAVQEGTSNGEEVSTFARYLGADNILLRHDVAWEGDGGARPGQMSKLIGGDAGLYGVGNFGRAGQNVLSPTNDPESIDEALLAPVQLYAVKDARQAVRVESTQGQVIVAGDGWAFPQMSRAGLLRTSPTVRYAQDLRGTDLAKALGLGGRLVITDTNARRDAIPQRLTAGQGALLAPEDELTTSRTLGTNPEDQTVLLRSGALAKASSSGGTFFDLPFAVPENAFDGNSATSWRFGDFRRAPGQRLTLDLPSNERLGDVSITQPNLGPVKIDRATLTGGGRSVSVRVPDSGPATFAMGGVQADHVTLTINSIRGEGFNLVGVSELGLPGATATRAARTPTTFTRLYSGLPAKDRAAFEKAPLDILLSRVQNTPVPADDSEIALRRVVSVPTTRTYDVSASVRVASGSLETLYDRSAGHDESTRITSSAFWFDKPQYRASQAADTSTSTGWIPGGASPKGAWWQASGERRQISTVTLTQVRGEGRTDAATQWATRASVYVDGHKVAGGALKAPGETSFSFDPVEGSTVRVVLDDARGPKTGGPAKFTTIDAGAQLATSEPGPFDSPGKNRCLPVATVDGRAVPMRLEADKAAGPNESGTRWTSCTPVTLNAGDRRIEQADGFVLDSMQLEDTKATTSPVSAQPAFTVTKNTPTTKRLSVNTGATPGAVVIGQSYDARWHASLGGKDLGPATTLDGFSSGWLLPAHTKGTVTVRFAPQRYADIALVLSILALIASVAIIVVAARAGRLAPEAPHRSELIARRDARASAAERVAAHAWVPDVVFAALATFGVGVSGLVGALAVVAATRLWAVRTPVLTAIGGALVLAGVGLFCLLDPTLGEVSADAISASLVPHHLAGAGLVIALGAQMRDLEPVARRRRASAHRQTRKGRR